MSTIPPRRTSTLPPSDPTATWDRPLRVQFIHGLESGPGASKAVYLARHFDTVTPAMDTRDFEGAFATQVRALEDGAPDAIVGSSFGGAIALALLVRGVFRGPTVLLAPAHRHYGVEERIPERVPVLIVHGTRDTVVSIEGSRALARTGTPGWVELVELDDEHRLSTVLEGDRLAAFVRRAFTLRG
jgi:alpha-beta hydrolase superfamily lysophospholipase